MFTYTFQFQVLLLSLIGLATTSSEHSTTQSSWLRHCDQDTPNPVQGKLEGHIPEWVEGRLIRVGPGVHHVGNTSYKHLFDPLALLHMVQIQDGQATYISRILESDTYKTNMREQRIAETEFGTTAYPDPCQTLFGKFSAWFEAPKMGDNCLVNVLQAKDQLIAMTETDTVRVVDPSNLQVIGDGVKIPDFVPVQRASAHPHVGTDGTIYNLAATISDRGPGYSIISHKAGVLEDASVEATIPARWRFNPGYMHSFAITENYYILFETPLAMNVPTMLASNYLNTPPEEGLVWYPEENTRFRVIRRSNGEEIDTKFTSDKFFTFHQINAYETADVLVVDVSAISSGEVIKSLYLDNIRKKDSDPTKQKFDSVATRYVMPLANIESLPHNEELLADYSEIKIVPEDSSLPSRSPSAVKTGDDEIFLKGVIINDMFLEMPRINYFHNGKAYKYVYGVGSESGSIDFTSLIKLDVRSGKELVWSDSSYFVSEPVYLSEPGKEDEDSGVILTLLLHKEELNHTVLLILNAQDFSEMARVHFTINGPATPTFHGQFISFHDIVHGY
uniref:EcBCO-like7 n=1 Tax=Palaemon carinicauda TaxID=392227 RepID=A0A7L7RYS5_PALCI|nr:EcBCO-like7 [Palaemon carinicauda]